MDPQTPKYSISEFAKLVRAKFPGAYDAMPDEELARKVSAKFPDYQSQIAWPEHTPTTIPASASLLDKAITLGLRVGPAVGGGILGSFVTPIAGTAAGGAAGAALGETLAEKYEQAHGQRQALSPTDIVLSGAMGAIPIARAAQGAPLLKRVGLLALQGAGLGGGGEATREAIEQGTLNPQRIATSALIGAGFGGVTGGIFKGKTPEVPSPALPARLAEIAAEQAAPQVVAKPPLGLRLRTSYVEALAPMQDLVAQTAKRFPLTTAEDPRVIAALVRGGIGGKVQNAFADYKALVHEAEQAGLLPQLKAHLNLEGYSSALRVLTGKAVTNEEIAQTLAAGKALPKGYDAAMLAADRQALEVSLRPDQLQTVQRLGDQVFALNRKALDIAHTSGIVSDDTYQLLVSRGNAYIPLSRIMDDRLAASRTLRAAGLSLKQQHVIQPLEGSPRTNIDPISASMNRYAEAVKESGRNDAAKAFIALRDKDPKGFGSVVLPLKPNQKPPVGSGSIGVFENGVARRFLLPEAIADSMSLINPADSEVLGGTILRFGRRLLQAGATTKSLAFAFRNPLRDFSDLRVLARGQSPYNPISFTRTVGTWISSLKEVATQSPAYREMMEAGGGYSTLQKNIDPGRFLSDRPLPQSLLAKAVRPGVIVLDKIASLNNILEETSKLASFKTLRAQGMAPLEAAWETRRYGGSPDFAAKGSNSWANLVFLFFSPQVRGSLRTISGLGRDPYRAIKVLGGATAMVMAARAWNGQFINPDDGQSEWSHIPENEKENFNIAILPWVYQDAQGRSHHWRIQVPRGFAEQMIVSGISGTLDSLSGKQSPLQSVLDVIGQVLPGQTRLKEESLVPSALQRSAASLNPALRVPLELYSNRKLFQGGPIEPRRLESGLPAESETTQTSPALKTVLDAISASKIPQALGFNLRAPQVQYGLESVLGAPARMAMDVADVPFAKPPVSGAQALTQTPVLGPVFRSFLGSTGDQVERDLMDQFYTALARSQQTQTSLSQLSREDPARANALLQQPGTVDELVKASALSSLARQLTQLEQARRMLLPTDTKTQSELHTMKIKLLQASLPLLRKGPIQ